MRQADEGSKINVGIKQWEVDRCPRHSPDQLVLDGLSLSNVIVDLAFFSVGCGFPRSSAIYADQPRLLPLTSTRPRPPVPIVAPNTGDRPSARWDRLPTRPSSHPPVVAHRLSLSPLWPVPRLTVAHPARAYISPITSAFPTTSACPTISAFHSPPPSTPVHLRPSLHLPPLLHILLSLLRLPVPLPRSRDADDIVASPRLEDVVSGRCEGEREETYAAHQAQRRRRAQTRRSRPCDGEAVEGAEGAEIDAGRERERDAGREREATQRAGEGGRKNWYGDVQKVTNDANPPLRPTSPSVEDARSRHLRPLQRPPRLLPSRPSATPSRPSSTPLPPSATPPSPSTTSSPPSMTAPSPSTTAPSPSTTPSRPRQRLRLPRRRLPYPRRRPPRPRRHPPRPQRQLPRLRQRLPALDNAFDSLDDGFPTLVNVLRDLGDILPALNDSSLAFDNAFPPSTTASTPSTTPSTPSPTPPPPATTSPATSPTSSPTFVDASIALDEHQLTAGTASASRWEEGRRPRCGACL
ncbi:uncharacterized protein SCHCODRAFT_01164381 [Schizophyllum commune H4-8]|nr:uncharacterized protein SCHCODRAFT_01164381 [Schizophyllum commune H4-8]KAI5885308.1 hypothetical protein SCHCODRAFT_01164381 [Schizophyllum commune H4-8]